MSNPALLGLLGVLITALGAYLVAARRFGGKIKTSEAAQLWEEAGNLRKEYRAEIGRLEQRLDEVEKRNVDLREENLECKRMIREHEKTIALLRDRVKELEVLNGRA